MNTIEVRVASKTMEAEAIFSYELVRLDGAPLPQFEAGAHIDVHLAGSLVRQYSLCNAPGETHRYLIAVLRDAESRGGSQAMHEHIETGAVLQISEPKNHFPLVAAGRTLLLAGGIGVTPILAMAEALAARGAAFKRRIGAAGFGGHVHFHHDSGHTGQKFDLGALLAASERDTHLYVCGPQGFIDHVLASAKAQGWPPVQLHVEYFSGAAVDTSTDRAFSVKLASSGRVLAVPADKTVIRVLAEQGVAIPYSCEEGVCGTCLTRVVDGTPDHRDMYLTDEERAANDQFTPCCSRSRTPMLTLDL